MFNTALFLNCLCKTCHSFFPIVVHHIVILATAGVKNRRIKKLCSFSLMCGYRIIIVATPFMMSIFIFATRDYFHNSFKKCKLVKIFFWQYIWPIFISKNDFGSVIRQLRQYPSDLYIYREIRWLKTKHCNIVSNINTPISCLLDKRVWGHSTISKIPLIYICNHTQNW